MSTSREVEWNENGEKKCLFCGNYFPPELFHYKTRCQDCYSSYQAEYREKHREELRKRKREMRIKAKEGSIEARRKREQEDLEHKLEAHIEDHSCKFCDVSDPEELCFLTPDGTYTLLKAKEKFTNDTFLELICQNCIYNGRGDLALF